MTTVIHIEDDPLWANFVRESIGRLAEFRLLGTASTGRDGLERCRVLAPRIVLLDLRLPDMDGLMVIDAFGALQRPPILLLFTSRADDAVMARLFREPVAGMLWKSPDCRGELHRAPTTVARGGTHYGADAKRAWHRFNALPNSYIKLLSATELRLLPHFSQGCTDAEIAALAGCAASTAHTHRKNIMAKLDLHTQAALQHWALQHGVFDPPRAAPPCAMAWSPGE